MDRRMKVMSLAVLPWIVGAYQMGLYPASGQTTTPKPTESPPPTTTPAYPSAPCSEPIDSLCRFTGTVVLGIEDCRFLDTGSDVWIGPLAGPLGFMLQPGARVTVTGSWRNDLPGFCSTPFNAQFVVSAVEILSSPTAVPTMSPPVLESPVPTSTPLLPALLPATGREPHGEAADTLLALPVVALVVGFALLLGRRYAK